MDYALDVVNLQFFVYSFVVFAYLGVLVMMMMISNCKCIYTMATMYIPQCNDVYVYVRTYV